MSKSLIEQFSNNNFLVTCDRWFLAPNGKMYLGAWGKCEVHNSVSTLGVKTNDRSTNWYIIVGEGAKRVIIAGCQIHFACVCLDKPNTEPVDEQKFVESTGLMHTVKRDNIIYIAQ